MDPLTAPPAPLRRPWYHWRRLGLNTLTLSIIAHLIFGVMATYLIVQKFQTRPKQAFAAAPPNRQASTKALEHKVQMQRKQRTASAPPAIRRVVTNSNARFTLPAVPAMPRLAATLTPLPMTGMSGISGMGMGSGLTGGGGNAGGGGNGLNLFGLPTGGGLEGHFYDLKQTSSRQPTAMTVARFHKETLDFVQAGCNESILAKFYRAPTRLIASQIFIPTLDSEEGPKAFKVESEIKANFTVVYYKGKVIASESGKYRFVGYGDNILVVRFKQQVVLDGSSTPTSDTKPVAYWNLQGETVVGSRGAGRWYHGSAVGTWVDVKANEAYDMDVLIGEAGGELSAYFLQVQKDGENYKKDNKGNPILPVFKLTSAEIKLPPKGAGHLGEAPIFATTGPGWRPAGSFSASSLSR